MTPIIQDIAIILLTMPVIFFTGQWFISASSNIGDHLRLPRSVKGATFDAIASSFPELMIALFSVIAFSHFEVGVGTIAGSAIFNLLVITGISVLVAPKVFKVSREVVHRDSFFYVVSVLVLLIALLGFKIWGIAVPLIFLLIYFLYIKKIIHDTKRHHAESKERSKKISLVKETSVAMTTMIIIGVAAYFLTEHSISLAEGIGISPIIIAFTLMAATTSLPDGVISVMNAKKGNVDDATSNVFGSNSFDILVGIGVPLLIAVLISGPVQLNFGNIEIIFGLLGSTFLIIYFLTGDYILKKKHGVLLLGIYAAFLIYVVYLAYR